MLCGFKQMTLASVGGLPRVLVSQEAEMDPSESNCSCFQSRWKKVVPTSQDIAGVFT